MKSFLLPVLLAGSSLAAELTIKKGPLESELTLDATFIPNEATVLKISPKQWSSFVITDLVDHGSIVKAGDPLITFDDEKFQRQLIENREAAKSRKLALAKAERELADLKLSTPKSLEGLKLSHDRAKEELDQFNASGQELSIESAKERLTRAQRALSYNEEELKQLLKMYEEDGITEETEEIILKRQRASVESARFAVKKTEKETEWTLEKVIPRQAVDLQRAFEKAQQSYETGQVSLPRALEEKTLALEKTKRTHAEADRKLAELEADAQFLSVAAPADGIIYYGEIDNLAWTPGNSPKFLKKKGSAPAETALMTLVPSNRTLTLQGSVAQAERLKLPSNAQDSVQGSVKVEGLKNVSFPSTLLSVASAPDAGGKYRLAMSVELPADSPIVTGMKGKVKLITFRKEDVISVPHKAITTKDEISTVKVKMADGQSETREVKLGHVAANKTEILEGLEVDQVILVPDPEKN